MDSQFLRVEFGRCRGALAKAARQAYSLVSRLQPGQCGASQLIGPAEWTDSLQEAENLLRVSKVSSETREALWLRYALVNDYIESIMITPRGPYVLKLSWWMSRPEGKAAAQTYPQDGFEALVAEAKRRQSSRTAWGT